MIRSSALSGARSLLLVLLLGGLGLSAWCLPSGAIPAPSQDAAGISSVPAADPGVGERVVQGLPGNQDALAVVATAPMIGFVIDNSASMQARLPQVRDAVISLLNDLPMFGGIIPPKFLLETYSDPTIAEPRITDNGLELQSWVLGIQAGGGGDCPEPAMAALLRAMGAATPNAAIFLFSDSDAKDCARSLMVVSLARKKNITIYTVLAGSCGANFSPQGVAGTGGHDRFSPTGGSSGLAPLEAQIIGTAACDAAYLDVASLTGGMRIDFPQQSGYLSDVSPVGWPYLDDSISLVAAVSGNLTTGVNSRTFPIDSTVERVQFIVRMTTMQGLVIRRPDGSTIPGDFQVGDVDAFFPNGRVISDENPIPGTWTVEMTGSGTFNINVLVKSPIALTEFSFVTVSGPTNNRVYTPICQIPLISSPVTAILGFAGVGVVPTARFIGADGGLVENISLAVSSNLTNNQRLASTPNINLPYRAQISGIDGNSFPYQRVSPLLTSPSELVMTASNVPAQMNANGTYFFNVLVQNTGATQTFDFLADASLRMDNVSVTPTSATIATGGSRLLTIRVDVPLDNLNTVLADFVVSARQASGAGNALVVPILVIENLPPDCSGSFVYGIDTSYQTYELEPLIFGGIFDPEGQPVAVEITDVLQDEPVEENTGGNANWTCPDALFAGGANMIRNESSANGNGRVYTGSYVASDPQGKQCTGTFTYCIPRRHGRGTTCTDDGQDYSSMSACTRFNFGDVLNPAVEAPAIVVQSSTPARFDLKVTGVAAGDLTIRVFDISGHLVERVWQGAVTDGTLTVGWDTSRLSSGIYFVRAETAGRSLVQKVLVAR